MNHSVFHPGGCHGFKRFTLHAAENFKLISLIHEKLHSFFFASDSDICFFEIKQSKMIHKKKALNRFLVSSHRDMHQEFVILFWEVKKNDGTTSSKSWTW